MGMRPKVLTALANTVKANQVQVLAENPAALEAEKNSPKSGGGIFGLFAP